MTEQDRQQEETAIEEQRPSDGGEASAETPTEENGRFLQAAEELTAARERIADLEQQLQRQSLHFAADRVMHMLGVRGELFEDVRLLAGAEIDASLREDGSVDEQRIQAAVTAVMQRLPSVAAAPGGGEASMSDGVRTGSRGNFARSNDSAALLRNRLHAARAAGDNALSVAVISEAAAMGIMLR